MAGLVQQTDAGVAIQRLVMTDEPRAPWGSIHVVTKIKARARNRPFGIDGNDTLGTRQQRFNRKLRNPAHRFERRRRRSHRNEALDLHACLSAPQ